METEVRLVFGARPSERGYVLVGQVPSSSSLTKVWEIKKKDGQLSCNCPQWIFHKECKHIQSYLALRTSLGFGQGD